jgi:F-type H+-transporting ATPase subunit delta
MVDLVAIKYVNALFSEKEKLDEISLSLEKIKIAFQNEQFKDIISSYEVAKSQKIELINSLIDSESVHNLVKLLAQKNRLELIPQIANELNKKINISKNIYNGIVYSKEPLNQEEIKELENKFSTKFDINLTLANKSGEYNGIKVEIEDLGVEVGFSISLIQSQLKDFVLKAV